MDTRSTREKIIDAADALFYQQGFEHTSFAHIADAVQISRGNFYHHFKSKDEILDAVIAARLVRTQAMLESWSSSSESPRDRIQSFIQILIRNLGQIKRYGCPVGSLSMELAKLDHASKDGAKALFALFRTWLRDRFEEMGCGAESDALAMHLLGRSQGVATLASAFRDAAFVRHEVAQMCSWLDDVSRACAGTPADSEHAESPVAAGRGIGETPTAARRAVHTSAPVTRRRN